MSRVIFSVERILGIDPGYGRLGYAVVEKVKGDLTAISFGVIDTPKQKELHLRLKIIYDRLKQIAQEFSPTVMAIEKLYFFRNVTTAIEVGESRGVALLVAAEFQMDVYEYTPHQVKQAVVGQGRATKMQVQEMVKLLYRLREKPRPDDVADALAVAWCHGMSSRAPEVFKGETDL